LKILLPRIFPMEISPCFRKTAVRDTAS
jgi:hypothetical protein